MKNLVKELQAQFDTMCATNKLFRSSITGQTVWELYLNGFLPENNRIFRDPESTEHNCNLCKNFIRRYGNIVAVDSNNNIISIWDNVTTKEYLESAKEISKKLQEASIVDIFMETYAELSSLPYQKCTKSLSLFRLGIDKNVKRYTKEEAEKFGVVKPNEIRTFDHLHLDLPKQFVHMGAKSIDSLMADYRSAKDVFKRGMETISEDTLKLVKDLINQDSLLDGKTHLFKIEAMIPLKIQFDRLPQSKQDIWCWVNSYNLPIAKFRNELIGTLCSDLSEGMELNTACQTWNKRVDPSNYMKAKAPITKFQIQEAKKFVEDNGYSESFIRRFATIEDIKASEILHINSGDGKIKEVSLFDSVKSTSTRHKKAEFDKVEEIHIEKFMETILPTCTSIEAFLTNNHEGNMVTLTTSNVKESKPIFKWNNNYSWTFNGNIAGKSQIKENVKNAGGKIEGILRCSLQWNDEDTPGIVDFDLHCKESAGTEIYFSNKVSHKTGGWLDVDMIRPSKVGIENITWQKKLPDMQYKFFVKNYCGSQNKGFKIEIEFDGNIFNYHYTNPVSYKQNIDVATVTVVNGVMSIVHHLPNTSTSKEVYGLNTNEFHKVNLVCLSPNHWDGNNIGNKHYMFMLENCKCPNSIRSFHIENLIPELAQHRKVLEVLGNTTMIEPTDKQLSGLGFNATVREELIVKVQGTHKRMLKIKF